MLLAASASSLRGGARNRARVKAKNRTAVPAKAAIFQTRRCSSEYVSVHAAKTAMTVSQKKLQAMKRRQNSEERHIRRRFRDSCGRSEVRNQKSEVRNQKSESLFILQG